MDITVIIGGKMPPASGCIFLRIPQLNYLYRQSAKVDIGINFSEAKNIVMKVRGLGSDDDGAYICSR